MLSSSVCVDEVKVALDHVEVLGRLLCAGESSSRAAPEADARVADVVHLARGSDGHPVDGIHPQVEPSDSCVSRELLEGHDHGSDGGARDVLVVVNHPHLVDLAGNVPAPVPAPGENHDVAGAKRMPGAVGVAHAALAGEDVEDLSGRSG